jgi:hypothetical protein
LYGDQRFAIVETPVIVIECTNCHARYQYDEERFDRKPTKKIKCAKCSTVFEIQNPAFAEQPKTAGVEKTYTSKPAKKVEPQDTTAQSPIPERPTGKVGDLAQLPEGKRLSLAVINGPDSGSVYRIEKPRVTIGRSGADLTLNDSECSRLHAAIDVRDTLYMLEDLDSTNGTLVDGARITGSVELSNHSEFQVGATTIMLIVTDDN